MKKRVYIILPVILLFVFIFGGIASLFGERVFVSIWRRIRGLAKDVQAELKPTSKVYTVQQDGLTFSVQLGNDEISAVNGKAYMLVTLEGEELLVQTLEERPPLNLAIVIDKSGSMDGDKIEYVKKAVIEALGKLNEGDSITIVTYSTDFQTIYRYSPRQDACLDDWYVSCEFDRQQLIEEVSSITSGGSTYLEGGLKEGLRWVNLEAERRGQENRVILLSDGLANVGESDPYELASIVEKLVGDSVTVSTIGVGADYDEKLMTMVAKSGRGNYYFLEDPKDAERIFTQEFDTALTTLAKDIRVNFNLNEEFVIAKGLGYEFDTRGYFEPYDIYAGRKVTYLFELSAVDAGRLQSGEMMLADLEIDFTRTTDNSVETIDVPISINVIKFGCDALKDDIVYDEYIQALVSDKLWVVYEQLDKSDNSGANLTIDELLKELKVANSRLTGRYDEQIRQLEEKQGYITDLKDEYINDSETGRNFQKSNQLESYEKKYNK
ncbi:VWA domain-containing protein [Candidatus Dojkabacteria bacterium]|nr:VWA domain-containing protein [Candidatus Dojkabacteria bacterium]